MPTVAVLQHRSVEVVPGGDEVLLGIARAVAAAADTRARAVPA
jgi:hypothetical protein